MTNIDFEELVLGFPRDKWWCITGGFARDLLSGSQTAEWRKDLDLVALKDDVKTWTDLFHSKGMSVRQKAQWPIRENLIGENFVYERYGIKIDGWFIDKPEPTETRAFKDIEIRITSHERMAMAKALFAEDQALFGRKFHDLPDGLRDSISLSARGTFFYKQRGEYLSKKTPSPWILARNAATDLMGWAQGGFRMANKELQEKRMGECSKCEFHKNSRCLKCGCFTSAKTRLASSKCPLGKW